jgi:hypothetical protein
MLCVDKCRLICVKADAFRKAIGMLEHQNDWFESRYGHIRASAFLFWPVR